MRRVASFLAGAVLVGVLVGGGSGATATTSTVQILYRADRHIPARQTCTKKELFVVPPTADGSVDGIERMAQVQGTSSVFVVGTRVQIQSATSGYFETCLNAPVPPGHHNGIAGGGGVNVTTLFFGIPAS